MITCVVLSAGLSSRFGSSKSLAKIGSLTAIEFLLKRLVATDLGQILVVLGANADQIKPYVLKHDKINIVYNKNYNLGQTSSFKAALPLVSATASGIMLLPVDYPFIQSTTINGLIKEFRTKKPLILVPTFNAIKGHPPLFSASLKEEFLVLGDDQGANEVVHRHNILLAPVSDEGVIATFNTPQEFSLLKTKYSKLF